MKYDSEKKLIESIYNVAIDPNNFQNFLDQWETKFVALSGPDEHVDNVNIVRESQKISEAVESHFFRVYAILDMVELNDGDAPSLTQQVEASPLPTFIIQKNGEILAINAPANKLLLVKQGQHIDDIPLRDDDLEKAKNMLENFASLEPYKVLTILQTQHSDDAEPIIFAVSKLVSASNGNEYLRFCAVHTIWNDEIGKIIQDTFGLTNMELHIAKRLVAGKKLSEIAENNNRSIYTVRTQSKSLFKKTKFKSQADLVKFFTMLQNIDPLESENALDGSDLVVNGKFLQRENGRNFYYETYGHPKGEPVLFMHGIMTGTDFTQDMSNDLFAQKIKLIAPHRPGFGKSDGLTTEDCIGFFTDDVLAMLDTEQVETCKILAHSCGSFYAYHLGSILPERITKIRVISGAVPFTSAEHMSALNPRQRVVGYTAKYTPKLLPFLLRSSEMQIKKYGAESLIDALYADSEFDYELIKQPEIRRIIVNGFEGSFAQGVSSVVTDGLYIFSDRWNDMLRACQMPMEVIHGADNQAVPMQQVKDFFNQHKNLSVEIVDGGQLILYKYFKQMIKSL